MKEAIQEAVNQINDGQPCVLATVVRTRGSTPQKSGAMLLVREDGTGVGTLGGGCVDRKHELQCEIRRLHRHDAKFDAQVNNGRFDKPFRFRGLFEITSEALEEIGDHEPNG